MHPQLARAIDKGFMTLMKAGVRPSAEPKLSDDDLAEGLELIASLDEAAAKFRPPAFLDARILTRPRTERFNEIVVRFDNEPFSLPVPLENSLPLVVHVNPPKGRLRAGMVFLHGWRQETLGAIGRFARYCAARGIASACIELPQHLSRAVRNARVGEGLVSLQLPRMISFLYHAAFEAEWVRAGMAKVLGVPVGTLGASLGGWLASLHLSIFEPDFVCLINPMADIVTAIRDGELLSPLRSGLSREQLANLCEALRAINPIDREPLIPGRLVSVTAGRFDLVTPYEGSSAFAAAVGARPIRATPHGHFSTLYFYPTLFPDVFAEIEELIREALE